MMYFYGLSQTLTFFTLILPAFPFPSANEVTARHAGHLDDCPGGNPVTVTVTVTETSKADPSAYGYVVESTYSLSPDAVSSDAPFPMPSELMSCFDRNYHAFTYFFDNGYHLSGQSQTTDGGPDYQTSRPTGVQSVPSDSKQSPSASSTSSPSWSTVHYQNATVSSPVPATKNNTTTTATSNSSCIPELRLKGADEDVFNRKSTPFSVYLVNCSSFDLANTIAFANFASIDNMAVTANSISFAGFEDDYILLSIFALDYLGNPIIKSYELHFGSIDMLVLVLGLDDQPASGVLVYGNATIYPGLSQSCVTDNSGRCQLTDLPATTIGLVARTNTNSIAVNGLAATSSQVTLKLSSFAAPSGNATLDLNDGLSGWTGGTVSQSLNIKRDTTLTVPTNGQYNLQTANGKFKVHPFSRSAYIKYKFVTREVPGGYFGTQFNDYYSVTIRSDTGNFVTVTNSMNALGLGAFDASGATDWFMLSLKLPENTKSIDYTIGVSNVADNLLDSSIIVDKAGEALCDKCGDCVSCSTDPMCQNTCKNPQWGSCDFYRPCAEGQLGCGDGGYPIKYGEKNCNKFKTNLRWFSPAGQKWIFDTMWCLQKAMVPVLQPCTADCDSFSNAAFNSHPKCYVDNGVCGLTCPDVVSLLMTIKGDLFADPKQILQSAVGCTDHIVQTLKGCTGELLILALLKGANSAAAQKMLNVAIKYFM